MTEPLNPVKTSKSEIPLTIVVAVLLVIRCGLRKINVLLVALHSGGLLSRTIPKSNYLII